MRLTALAAAWLFLCSPSLARDFDFYVLSLSWSPSYCAAEGAQAEPAQCSGGRPYAFVVHGLWPQLENGFPEFCDPSPEWVPNNVVNSMLDLMPSRRLIIHEWKKHGTCSGLPAADYFALVRDVRTKVNIPAAYSNPQSWQTVSPATVEAEFRKANPGLKPDAIAVTCDNRHLREVRLCLTPDLNFRSCPEVDRRSCKRQDVVMPPLR
ncbi:ribonuclease [Terrihabitans soli]|uniref:Ribonuclease n=1 Tax=Terrihabitans soli TaxID=708113 RepID=A0A6S6QMH5_9HYPH|nr:ribonuclease T2 [Terrihabitans soli]BCJ90139.1 ribonuclease [Terrihabitans soli]